MILIEKKVLFLLFALVCACGCKKLKVDNESTESKEYNFSEDWFSHNTSVWREILQEFKDQPDVRYLELGVFEGRSFTWILDNIITHSTAEAVAVDYFPNNLLSNFKKNLAAKKRKQKIKILKGRFNKILGKLREKSFDIIYLDGGHMSWSTLETTLLAWPLLKNNGILIFDDYLWNNKDWPSNLTPKPAIDAFLTTHKNFIEIIYKGYQVMVRRVRGACESAKYSCTPIGQWSYTWGDAILRDSTTQKQFRLNEEQRLLVETLIKNYPMPLGRKQSQNSILTNKDFSELVKQFK